MWIFTTGGFVSAVEHRDNDSLAMVRARDRLSLDSMLLSITESFVEAGYTEDDAKAIVAEHEIYAVLGDYKWRVVIPKSMFAMFTIQESMKYLNYANFKNKLTATRGDKYHNVAMRIWTAALELTDTVKTGNDDIDNPKPYVYKGYHFDSSKGYRGYETAADFVGSTFLEPPTYGTTEDADLPTDQELIDIRDREEGLYVDDWEVWEDGTQFNIITGQIRTAPKAGGIMSMTEDEFQTENAYREMTDAEYDQINEYHQSPYK